jgi:hypothetical protein
MVSINIASSKVSLVSFQKFGSPQQVHAKDYQISQGYSARRDRQTQREANKRRSYLDFAKLSFIWVLHLDKSKRKTNTTQTTTAIPPLCHQESHVQVKEGCTMPVSPRPVAPGSRGHPSDRSSGLRCVRILEALARSINPGSVIG